MVNPPRSLGSLILVKQANPDHDLSSKEMRAFPQYATVPVSPFGTARSDNYLITFNLVDKTDIKPCRLNLYVPKLTTYLDLADFFLSFHSKH